MKRADRNKKLWTIDTGELEKSRWKRTGRAEI